MKDKKKPFFTLVLLSLLMLTACGKPDCKLEERIEVVSEVETESVKDDIWPDKIYITEEQFRGNILGYSLKRNQVLNMWYEQDMPYLLDETAVGDGMFVSEYMCETEVFISSVLKDVLINRGKVNSEQKQYFTDWALEQLALADWDLLDEQWSPDLYAYDRNYELNSLLGKSNYSFSYVFYADEKGSMAEELNFVEITCSVNSEGKIYEITIRIDKAPADNAGMEQTVNLVGLFDDAFKEIVIRNGNVYSGKILLDFEKYLKHFLYPDEIYEQSYNGLLISGDAALSAESIGKIFGDVLEARGENAGQYANWFAYDNSFDEFKNNPWDCLEENWTADAAYDCMYIDNIDTGYVGLQYYFYPDYNMMGTDTAKAVIINCNVDIAMGKLVRTDIRLFPMTRQERQTVKERNEEESWNIAVIEKGQVMSGRENVSLPMPQNELVFMPIEEFYPEVLLKDDYEREKQYELWGYSDVSEAAAYLGELFLKDIENETVEKGSIRNLFTEKADEIFLYRIAECAENSMIDKEYDCYYMQENECAGNLHLKYYFNLQGTGENHASKKVMVINLYVSDLGIEYIQVNDFQTVAVEYEKTDLWENTQTVWTNSYFLDRDYMYLKAKAKYEDIESAEFVEEVVYAEMYLVKEYEQGSVFKFAVEPLGALTEERLNTYFYVTDDKIYRLFSYVYQDDEVLTFYDNDELLTEVLDTDEKLINNGQIVCQDEEMKRELTVGDSEFHFSILKSENQISYNSCEITPNGEVYYYESFVWEKDKGLIEFNSGYRAEREPLYITEISEISEERPILEEHFWEGR